MICPRREILYTWYQYVLLVQIVITLDEMHSSAVLSLLVFFCEIAVGVGVSVERDDQLAGKRSHDGDPPGELCGPRPVYKYPRCTSRKI